MTQEQVNALRAQAQAMVLMCDAMMGERVMPVQGTAPEVEPVAEAACLHPSDMQANISTMGGNRTKCMQCYSEVPQPIVTE